MNENKRKYINRYNAETYKKYTIRIRRDDKEVIAFIEKQSNKNEFITELIKKEMRGRKMKVVKETSYTHLKQFIEKLETTQGFDINQEVVAYFEERYDHQFLMQVHSTTKEWGWRDNDFDQAKEYTTETVPLFALLEELNGAYVEGE